MLQVDAFFNGQQIGNVANALVSDPHILRNGRMEPGAMRPYYRRDGRPVIAVNNGEKDKQGNLKLIEVPVGNATLRKDEWEAYDKTLLETARIRLVGWQDLQNKNLMYNIGNGFAKTVLAYEEIGEMKGAEMSMDGTARAKADRPVYNTKYLPLPIVHYDFSVNARVLAESRQTGTPIDTVAAQEAGLAISEFLEEMLFVGPDSSTYSFGGGTIYGYTNFPGRITGSLTANWDSMSDDSVNTVGEKILSDVLDMKQDSIDALHYGPWILYVPTAYETTMEKDYNSGRSSSPSIRQRIENVSGIEAVKVADKLPANNVVLVQMTSNVVRVVNGMPLSNVEWKTGDQMVNHFKAMTIQVPQLRRDANGNTGIVHYT